VIIAHGSNNINHAPGAAFRLKFNIRIMCINKNTTMIKNLSAASQIAIVAALAD